MRVFDGSAKMQSNKLNSRTSAVAEQLVCCLFPRLQRDEFSNTQCTADGAANGVVRDPEQSKEHKSTLKRVLCSEVPLDIASFLVRGEEANEAQHIIARSIRVMPANLDVFVR